MYEFISKIQIIYNFVYIIIKVLFFECELFFKFNIQLKQIFPSFNLFKCPLCFQFSQNPLFVFMFPSSSSGFVLSSKKINILLLLYKFLNELSMWFFYKLITSFSLSISYVISLTTLNLLKIKQKNKIEKFIYTLNCKIFYIYPLYRNYNFSMSFTS